MDKKKPLLFCLIGVLFIGGFSLFLSKSLIIEKSSSNSENSLLQDQKISNGQIPVDFYQDIEIGKNYVYKVSGFGSNSDWKNFTEDTEDFWTSDIDQNIIVNFTGFFERDPNDPGDSFSYLEIPWINLSIFEEIGANPSLNYTNANVSNSEVARNLKLGFSNFLPGFLITINHTDWVKANATAEANGASGPEAKLTMEETYTYLYFKFEETNGNNQVTELIYSKKTGLLIRANTSIGTYHLDIILLGDRLDLETQYVYNVNNWGNGGRTDAFWWGFSYPYFKGVWSTNIGGQIKVNFTGRYGSDPGSFGDVFEDDEVAWLDFEVYYKGDFGSINTFNLYNISNEEVYNSMTIGYNGFQSAFNIPIMENETRVKELAVQEATGYAQGNVKIEETDLTMKISFDQISGFQETYMVYEKISGLLLWCDTQTQNYRIELTIVDYSLPTAYTEETSTNISSDDDDDDNDDDNSVSAIPSYHLIIIIALLLSMTILIIIKSRKSVLKQMFNKNNNY
ncbi:MAG: hypothetical protein GF353_12400 [Candidatus Lokiarchaeota archaeon]|nr:hypothetical protein [Candidatus Lokiarchaeota archaeon]